MKNLKIKLLALTMGASVFICGKAFAQVPSYAPTNGLVGWWPFNGNANDESGNGNNGTVNGATLNTDRFGNANKAYDFSNSGNQYIDFGNISVLNSSSEFSVSAWFNYSKLPSAPNDWFTIFADGSFSDPNGFGVIINPSQIIFRNYSSFGILVSTTLNINTWYNIVVICSTDSLKIYLNGILIGQNSHQNTNLFNTNYSFKAGKCDDIPIDPNDHEYYFNGRIDEIGMWKRVLTECEIQDLYKSQTNSVAGAISISPQTTSITSNVSLSTSTNSTNIQWQTNGVNLGWQNVPSNSTYSGGTTNTLTVNNVQLANHNQPFRVIASYGNCTDTSNIATIEIADTCITNVTVYDTLLTTVTDTLIINTTLSLPSPNNENTIKIYPNPASDHIMIDNGNFVAMAGYSIKITNNAGQQVFQNAINQAQFNVDLSTWSGNGLYFVHLIDSQNNTVTIRKIVLQ